MVGNAYLAVVTVIAWFFFLTLLKRQNAKVCFGSASEKCETGWSPYISGA